MELRKLKVSRSSIIQYRDVTLAEGDGKFISGLLRTAAHGAVSCLVLETQVGSGFHGAVSVTVRPTLGSALVEGNVFLALAASTCL